MRVGEQDICLCSLCEWMVEHIRRRMENSDKLIKQRKECCGESWSPTFGHKSITSGPNGSLCSSSFCLFHSLFRTLCSIYLFIICLFDSHMVTFICVTNMCFSIDISISWRPLNTALLSSRFQNKRNVFSKSQLWIILFHWQFFLFCFFYVIPSL